MSTINIHKFGGSSLANVERFIALKNLLKGKKEVIVVSATQGTTTALQEIIDAAEQDLPFQEALVNLEKKHIALANSLLAKADKKNEIIASIQQDFIEIKNMLSSLHVTGSCPKELQDFILGYGEIWSATILSNYLGLYGNVMYLDASNVLYAYESNGMKCIDWEKSSEALHAFLKNKSFDQIVITGFIASTLDGRRTTLGRNGSDFSAAAFAKLFAAKELLIWTDVDGIYTADPHRVRSAFVIESLSYNEALELAYFGAKVLHPMTIAPARESGIPIYIKNSFKPEAKGTLVSATPQKSRYTVKGLTCIDDISLINIEGTGMTGVSGIAARIFEILHQQDISVILISQASSEHSICFATPNACAEAAVNALRKKLQFEIEKQIIESIHVDQSCAILSAVGDEMAGAIGISGRLFYAIAKANINIRAIAQGSSERNISVVVSKHDVNRALQAGHAGFYLSRATISIGLIGPGLIGRTLLKQIQTAINELESAWQVNLVVRGIMNSKKMLLDQSSIDLNNWQEQLNNSETKSDLKIFADHIIADDFPHAVIIDCTADKEVAHHYIDFIKKGISVITPNKHTNAGDLAYYKKLKSLTLKKNQHYLYEATVCAGLPVINTLQDILKTGDRVLKVEGIVSGTLSYIFNELAKGRKFSDIILEAKKLGITEPDPREDLSGMDVARKLVCLAREIGHDVSLEDVKVNDLVPEKLKACSMQDFLKEISAHDDQMQALISKAKASNEKLCYVGAIEEDGQLTVSIKSFPSAHPFARLEGTDNMLIFHTLRYHQNPLIIQGPGAGAEVTAAGIFADLLRLTAYFS